MRAYRERKRFGLQRARGPPKSGKQRAREYRERQKAREILLKMNQELGIKPEPISDSELSEAG